MFIAFDGIDASGKTTQIQLLYDMLLANNYETALYNMGQEGFMDKIFLDLKTKKITCDAEIRELLYYFEGVLFGTHIVNPLLTVTNRIGLVDRYILSFFAYGPLNGIPLEKIKELTKSMPWPDLYFFINTTPEQAIQRIKKYRKVDVPEIGYKNNLSSSETENQSLFVRHQEQVYHNFLHAISDIQSTQRVIVLDGNQSKEDLFQVISSYILECLTTGVVNR